MLNNKSNKILESRIITSTLSWIIASMLSLLMTSMLSLGRAREVRGEARGGGGPLYSCPAEARARAAPRARFTAHLWGPAQGEHAGQL